MKILVVDDQAANRVLLSYLLEDDGHEVIEASNGEDGILKFQRDEPDLVLLDVMMPGVDGYEVARALKSHKTRHVPIIFLTALSDDVSLSRCIESGGDDFLTKPVNETLLAAKIKAHERIRDLNAELTTKNQELEQLHKLLRQEHDLAEYVFDTAIKGGLNHSNVRHYLSPMGGFSGDVILSETSGRGTLFVLLGDFTGHGLPAALGALPVKQAFTNLVREGANVGEIATHLNQTLFEYLPGHMFCAATIIEYNPVTLKAICWLGGLPDMFHLGTDGCIRHNIRSQHMPLGVLSAREFRNAVVNLQLEAGERLFLYSDGVTDCCDVHGEMLGEQRFELMFNGSISGDELFDSIVTRVRSFGSGRPQDDDVSMLEVMAIPGEPLSNGYELEYLPNDFSFSWCLELPQIQDNRVFERILQSWASHPFFQARKDDIYEALECICFQVLETHYLDVDADLVGADMNREQRVEIRHQSLLRATEAKLALIISFNATNMTLEITAAPVAMKDADPAALVRRRLSF
ncbi:MAG: fused response regulator/phosphatase [Pseudomonadales bacterium]|nr:fused response regulator/phosphatase [Pseudomonadales bacterium]